MTAVKQLSEDQRDCLQEVVNVAMGQAADALARLLGVFVDLSIPNIEIVVASDILGKMQSLVASEVVSAVRQGFQGSNEDNPLRGESIVIFGDTSFGVLASLMDYEGDVDAAKEVELLLDVSNLINGACLGGLADQLQTEFSYSAPSVIGRELRLSQVLDKNNITWEQAVLVKINYGLEKRTFSCDLLFLMPGDAIENLRRRLDRLLDEL